jgi:hypothetical protein
MPWVMMVDSSATTGRPAARAAATAGEWTMRLMRLSGMLHAASRESGLAMQ